MSFVRVSKRFSIGYRSSRVSDFSLQGFEKGKLALTYQSFNLALWPAALARLARWILEDTASLDVHPHNLFEYCYYTVIGWNGLPLLHLKDLG